MSNTPKQDDARTGGGIGDIPAQPIDPAAIGSGSTDPQHDGDGVDIRIPTEDAADEAEGQPT
jgi:hypothetical protein